MAKAKAHPNQLGFDFAALIVPAGEAALAGFERRINVLVGEMLNSDGRDRYEIAAEVSRLLGEDVSKAMLDAYASPAREEHRVPFSRLMAIVVVTGRFDLFDRTLRECGCAVVTGAEIDLVELGNAEREKRLLEEKIRMLRRTAPTIRRGGNE